MEEKGLQCLELKVGWGGSTKKREAIKRRVDLIKKKIRVGREGIGLDWIGLMVGMDCWTLHLLPACGG